MIQVDGTLKTRLALWLLVTFGGLGGFLMIEAYTSAQRDAERAFDSQLQAAALTIAEAIQWQGGEPLVEIPAAALQILATRHQERVFYAILNANGTSITRNMPTIIDPQWRHKASQRPIWRDARIGDTPIRLYGYELDTAGWEAQDPVQIWVGHTLAGRHALASELFERAMTRFAVMVLLAGLLMTLAMRGVLKPLRKLRQLLRQRENDDTQPLHARVPKELLELTETLNSLFARQREGRENLLRFTADASHQIKTPLTGLRSTCELALQSRRPEEWRQALETVNDNATRTSRLAEQLLSLARLRHASSEHERGSFDLVALLRDCVMEWAERATSRNHDLGLAPLPDKAMMVRGEPWSLHELVGNLVDNALRYTPPGTIITLGLQPGVDTVTLIIEDDGPGVPEGLLSRLHQPFERAGRHDAEGSGLGMAIVDSIARQHGAILSLGARSPTGLCVAVRFPLENAT
ncbi:two-component system, OmpR family, sensor histidine kinase TctE [Modicisalibacter muralis]|uniref:histidine kinase n=1 Tax=Modicisalibacter muralis TaxID=119000 RepID=A0A1G9IHV8_9GAMM|nr:sensor histidine kinase [Halomonas muralis]SDL24767.1 two-component system, OmpR family, sensor histidine kinase TctE [Halomonas muralis]